MTINNSIFNISLNALYNSIENIKQIINVNTKKTFFGFLIHHSIGKDINNYELLDPHTGEILCMDEEICCIVSKHIDSYTLFCINDKSHIPFQLMYNELIVSKGENNILQNASLACNICKHHSLNGCTNIDLIHDYYSALDEEKGNILNGEYCKCYCKQINNI
mgnify:CR=1 FL=1